MLPREGLYYFGTEPGDDGSPSYTPIPPNHTTPPAAIPVDPTPPGAAVPPSILIVAAPAPPPPPVPRSATTRLPVPVVDPAPRYAISDYATAARALLPRGRAWPDDPQGGQSMLLNGLATAFYRSDAQAGALLAGSLPGNPTSLLPEWEAALGLPDPCIGPTPTIAQRLNQVRGRLVGAGGQSRARYVLYASALGFEITITNYAPFRTGRSAVGQPLASDRWTFVWGVTIVATTGALSADVLRCELEAVKPAETTIIFLN